jgi:DNA-binding PadR family transcriptional regulator
MGRRRIYRITPKGDQVLRFALDHLKVSIMHLENLLEHRGPVD